jgi:two-component system, chemotaxis family, sensor kinase CheA
MNGLLEQFLIESRDLIRQATEALLALERSPEDAATIGAVFRAFHTLKGSSGLFDLKPMTTVLHAAEDILAAVRDGRQPIETGLIDALLGCLDQTARWLDDLERLGALPARAAETAAALVGPLRAPTEPLDAAQTVDLEGFTAADRATALARFRAGRSDVRLFRVTYHPDSGCFFNGDDPLRRMRELPDLVALRIISREPWPAPEALDPFLCNLHFDALALGDEAALRHHFRLVADQVRIAEIARASLTPPADHPAAGPIVRALLTEQVRFLEITDPSAAGFAGRLGSAAAVAANALRYDGRDDQAALVEAACRDALARHDTAPLLDALNQILHPREPAPAESTAPSTRQLRVNETRVDRLLGLVGELIVAKNTLGWLGQQAEDSAGPHRDLTRSLQDLHGTLDRLTRDLHHAVLQIRMLPVAQVFDRFPRLVRDLSHRLGKPVDLILEGGDTAADKTVVEMLFEPLLHILRNSLDHGIEPPEERRRLGKPARATLALRAFRHGDRMVIETADDGRGIDIAAVRRKAAASGQFDPEHLDAMTEAEAARLIFAPGLSTADRASDLSGRGVGMHAVRMAVERAGGHVDVSTKAGQGTVIRLELPLTLALLRIVTVTANGRLFGIPLDRVGETVRIPRDHIRRVRNQPAFVWRDQIVPTHMLADLLHLPGDCATGETDALILVVRTGDGLAGLQVDGIGDRLDVALRPMDGLLADIPAYLGTTLLGDGRVLLVLNLGEILQ